MKILVFFFLLMFGGNRVEPIKYRAFKFCAKSPGYEVACVDTDNIIVLDLTKKYLDIYGNKDIHYDLLKIESNAPAKGDLVITCSGVNDEGVQHHILFTINEKAKEDGEAAKLFVKMPNMDILYKLKYP